MSAVLPVPLPLDPAPQTTPTLRERARAAFQAGELSQARAAVEIGISDSALSQWLAGKYSGSEDAVSAAVQRWIETRAARARLSEVLPADPEWFNTPSAEIIMAGLSYAQMAGDICLVYGAPGIGKTRAARHYATQYANVWVVQMFPTCTLWSCLDRTARAVGLRASHSRSSRIEGGPDRAAERLARPAGHRRGPPAGRPGPGGTALAARRDRDGPGADRQPIAFQPPDGPPGGTVRAAVQPHRQDRPAAADDGRRRRRAAGCLGRRRARRPRHRARHRPPQGRPAETDQGLALGEAGRSWRRRYGQPAGRRIEGFERPGIGPP